MPTLVSPGVAVSVIDESIHASSGPGTIPLIILATASNKLTPDGTAIAEGTIPANAGKLELITSQRELLQKYGIPFFQEEQGSIVQGSEISEYGLFAAYSYLGIANRAYTLRASVDLSQLTYNQDAPRGLPVNGTYWFDIENTSFGIFRANGNTNAGLAWTAVTPLLPAQSDLTIGNVPLAGYGADGDIAVVTQTTDNFVYEKISGAWTVIGTTAWKASRPTVAIGTVVNPVVNLNDTLTINGTTVTFTTAPYGLTEILADIVAAFVPSVTVSNNANRLEIDLATGEDITLSGSAGVLAALGLVASYKGYKIKYATHVSIPVGTHSGDIWVKTTNPNFGANYIVKRFNSQTGQFATVAAPLYASDSAANTAYGTAKEIGSLYVHFNPSPGTSLNPIASQVIKRWDGSTWAILTYEASATAPTSLPADGTLWISDELKVDIMVNDGDEWKGYLNNFPTSDPNGVQITSAQPTTQSDGTPLVADDLWLNSDDADNYPALYRWDGAAWVLIDKTDQTTPFGIIFADARHNEDGSETGSEDINDMLVSDFVDPDAPNPQTYPAGMLLFNTRYSTNNVKEWKTDYVDNTAYTVGAFIGSPLTYTSRWVTKSGNAADGSPFMGRFAQRQVVIEALAAAIVGNDDIRSEFVFYNLLSTPGYPELIDEMITLNVDRKETAFIITDTPFRLKPDGTSINNWATNAANVPSTNEFGRTNRYTYAAEYYPQGLSTDLTGNEVMVPASTIALRTYAYNDSVAYPWFPPAGVARGVITNASSVGYLTAENEFQPAILNQGQRDTLYLNNINPLAFLPNRGLVVYGDKTLHPDTSALDRVNVARLICYLRYQLDQLAQSFLFQLNTDATRQAAKSVFERFLGDLITVDAVTDFVVVCDRTNNTPERIDRNELWIDVAIVPTKSINFIYIPIRIVRTGEI